VLQTGPCAAAAGLRWPQRARARAARGVPADLLLAGAAAPVAGNDQRRVPAIALRGQHAGYDSAAKGGGASCVEGPPAPEPGGERARDHVGS